MVSTGLPNGSTSGSGPPQLPVDSPNEDLEPIAVVGFSLKFPQDATSPESFWRVLEERRCSMTEWPKDRLNVDAFYHPDHDKRDTIYARGGHFLRDDLALFDASFFSITATEAAAMDPQQRLLLETTYRALENAGIPMEHISGTNTGVYTGSMAHDYRMVSGKDVGDFPKYGATGTSINLLANRLSWFFNLRGPSVNLDSACSSSLMALDFACQGLRNGDSSMALVAGANVVLALDPALSLTNMNFLSSDSLCYSFDARANGYSRGEGFGVIVIKRVSDAIRDGDTIRAIIRSVGSNQDGHTPGITQPSKEAQASLIRQTYEKAGLDFATTRFFEAHGTGTAIGDPIEADAIGSVFRSYRSAKDPLYLGAVKSNVGHLEGGSGIAGLIKTIMILEKGVIPPNANFQTLNPRIDAAFSNIKIPIESVSWPYQGLRRASVNSFGFGGSNSHVILEDAYNFLRARNLTANHSTVPEPPNVNAKITSDSLTTQNVLTNGVLQHPPSKLESINGYPNGDISKELGTQIFIEDIRNVGYGGSHKVECLTRSKLLVWSAADESGSSRLIEVYKERFSGSAAACLDQRTFLDDLAHTLAYRRSSLLWRSFAVVDSIKSLQDIDTLASKPTRSKEKPGVGFVFTGQGAQYARMGVQLLAYETFRSILQQIDQILRDLGCGWSLIDELTQDEVSSHIELPEYSQALCTSLQIAIVELLRKFNIVPAWVLGHSSGEIAAAYAVGGLSLRSACKVAYFRGKFAGDLARTNKACGAMMSINLSEAETESYLSRIDPSNAIAAAVTIACINSPKNVTLSGNEVSLDTIKTHLDRDGVFARRLNTGVAYHSPYMLEIAPYYKASISGLEKGQPLSHRVHMVSTTTGHLLSAIDVLSTPEYWVTNMVSPVRFSQGLACMVSQSRIPSKKKLGVIHRGAINDLVEIGPHSALLRPMKEILEYAAQDTGIRCSSILSRYDRSNRTTLQVVGSLWALGHPVALDEANFENNRGIPLRKVLTDLPEYPFNHSQMYWHESMISKGSRLRENPRLDLLGTTVADWNPLEAKWHNSFNIVETPWLQDHKVNGATIYPAAGMMVMALEGARQMAQTDRQITGYSLKDTTFSNPIPISNTGSRTMADLYMRPLRHTLGRGTASSEFRICVLDSDKWVESCRGYIQVHYKDDETEVDRGREDREILELYQERYGNAVRACHNKVESKRTYKQFEAIGLGYGPAFRVLEHLAWGGDNEAIAEIKTFQNDAHGARHPVQPHVIHPVTLDAVAQLMWVALTKGGADIIPTSIPTRVRKAWISSSGLGYPEPTVLQGYSSSRLKGLRATDSSMFVLDKEGILKLSISHMETTMVSTRDALFQNLSDQTKLCYSAEWKPDPELMDPRDTKAYCERIHPHFTNRLESGRNVELLCIAYMFSIHETSSKLDVASLPTHLRKYLEWMRTRVERLQSETSLSMLENHKYLNLLTASTEINNAQSKLIAAASRNLFSLIRKESTLETEYLSEDLVADYFTEAYRDALWNEKLKRYLDILAHKNPALQILEIGAGSGSMTDQILESLTMNIENEVVTPKFSRYEYTDISEAFFEDANKRFVSVKGKMGFKTLDIDKDPLDQGFLPQSYDLVVAANALHFARDIISTVKNLRKLLKSGGKLILCEITKLEAMRSQFVFGQLPEWWHSTEKHRQWTPCLSVEGWNKVLFESGFSGVDFALDDSEDPTIHEMSIIISTAHQKVFSTLLLPETVIVVVIESDSVLQRDLALQIRSWLQETRNLACVVLSMDDIIEGKGQNPAFYVFLPEIESTFLYDLKAPTYAALQVLLASTSRMLWVTHSENTDSSSPKLNMVTGLAAVFLSENSNKSFTTLAFDESLDQANTWAQCIVRIIETMDTKSMEDSETSYVVGNGSITIKRFVEANYLNHEVYTKTVPQLRVQQIQGLPLVLTVGNPGLLETLQFSDDAIFETELAPFEIEIEVRAVGLNFRDLMVALGKIDESTIGCECAGVITRTGTKCGSLRPGERVCAAVMGCMNTFARFSAELAVKLPSHMSFTDAAALPVTGATAYYALVEVARLQEGESILIHAASGGTGQMAVQLALSIGAEVYITVGFDEKKKLMMDLYHIPEDHIFYSRNTSFSQGVMRMTRNRGVDVVLNSLAGDSLTASWECIAPYGRFVEIGKTDIKSNTKLPMSCFENNVSFSAIALDHMCTHRPSLTRKVLLAVMALVEKKTLKIADPLHIYPISEVEKAFRYLQSGRSTGKIVLSFNPTDLVPTFLRSKSSYEFDPDATYLVAGGLGGLGRSAARWMAGRGARNLILLSRNGPKSEAALELLRELRALGLHVETPACDVSSFQSLSAAISQCTTIMPRIKGCIQGTMVLRDAIFENMSFADWSATIRSKVHTSWNLHKALPSKMDFFIMLSSLAGIIGSIGQSNYAAGNTFQDALAQHRLAIGQKATAIDLGWMGDVGVIAENEEYRRGKEDVADMIQIRETEFQAILDYYCDPKVELPSPSKAQPIIGLATPAQLRSKGLKPLDWMQRPAFSPLTQMGLSDTTSSGSTSAAEVVDYAVEFQHAPSTAEAAGIVVTGLLGKLSKALSISPDEIDTGKPLHSYGVDSLLAVELRNWFGKDFKADVAIFDVMGSESIAKVGNLVAGKSKLKVGQV